MAVVADRYFTAQCARLGRPGEDASHLFGKPIEMSTTAPVSRVEPRNVGLDLFRL